MLAVVITLFLGALLLVQYVAGLGDPRVWAALGLSAGGALAVSRGGAAALATLLLAVAVAGLLRWRARFGLAGADDPRGIRRLHWAFVLVLLVILVVVSNAELHELANVLSRPTDFGTFYHAAESVAGGGDAYEATKGGYFYPPTFAFALGLLSFLPVVWASLLWFIVKLFLLVAMCRWTFELLDGRSLGPRARTLFLFGVLAATARFWMADLQYGNTNLVIAFLTLGCIRFDLRSKPLAAGALLAAAATIKVVPAILLLWLAARHRWRTIGAFAVAVLLFNALPLFAGPELVRANWQSYLETGVRNKLMDDLAQPDNQSMWGALARSLPPQHPALRPLWGLLSALFLTAALWFTTRTRTMDRRVQATSAALFAGLQLVLSPGSWVVHYVAAFLPMAALLRIASEHSALRRESIAAFVLANLAFTVSGWSRPTVRWSLQGSWFLLAILVVLGSIAAWLLRASRSERIRTGPEIVAIRRSRP